MILYAMLGTMFIFLLVFLLLKSLPVYVRIGVVIVKAVSFWSGFEHFTQQKQIFLPSPRDWRPKKRKKKNISKSPR